MISSEIIYETAPKDWKDNGIPYGSRFRCFECKAEFRSTFTFDCYADNPGDMLKCERCLLEGPAAVEEGKK